jgi:hypothetical protein
MPFVPEISAEFSAPPEFSGDVLEKDLSTGWTFRLQTRYSSTAPLHPCYEIFWPFLLLLAAGFSGRICLYWPGFSGRICSSWPGFSGRFCCYWPRDFLAVSVVACWDFQAWECKKSPSRDQKAGIFRPYL